MLASEILFLTQNEIIKHLEQSIQYKDKIDEYLNRLKNCHSYFKTTSNLEKFYYEKSEVNNIIKYEFPKLKILLKENTKTLQDDIKNRYQDDYKINCEAFTQLVIKNEEIKNFILSTIDNDLKSNWFNIGIIFTSVDDLYSTLESKAVMSIYKLKSAI